MSNGALFCHPKEPNPNQERTFLTTCYNFANLGVLSFCSQLKFVYDGEIKTFWQGHHQPLKLCNENVPQLKVDFLQ